ncbi:MAG: non-homologous end-joining DNA ligase [Acidimicrobiia bacterium]|nr:non-homologous end-joining DNA ligase [Acidimicrobiia bacterium]NNC75099.1 ATP-dependent DNA ligase [Acidimicrobiia bacterium]
MTGAVPTYQPMLATPWPSPFEDPDWRFEIKWDGVRALVYVDGDDVKVMSRRGNDATSRYPELAGIRLPGPAVLDGEIVALDAGGRPSFELLQARMNLHGHDRIAAAVGQVPVSLVVYDLLHLDEPLIDLPWTERRARLENLDLPAPCAPSEVVADSGPLWEFVQSRDLEGIVAKRAASLYRSGARSPDWRKVANWKHVKAVVGGYLPGEGGRSDSFASLVVGLHTDAGLRWVGQVGTGFDERSLQLIRAALDEMAVDRSPFIPDELPPGAVWVAPQLVAAIRYKEVTSAGRLRAPTFKGFTGDLPADVRWETEFERVEDTPMVEDPPPSSV